MPKRIPINVNFLYDWWDKNFYVRHKRPEVVNDSEFERVYLERKRFLFEKFGEFGIGEEKPVSDGNYVNLIRRWCVDFIPYILGAKLKSAAEGFWHPQTLTEEEIIKLRPVDIASLPYGEWILKRKEALVRRYGRAENGQIIEGSVNAAFRIRGEELYYDMLCNKELVRNLLDVVTETVIMTYQFFAREFNLEHVFLANCTINHIGPDLYNELCLENDIRLAKETKKLFNKDNHVYLHHCDLPIDKFVSLYKKIPYLYQLDGAHTSDIKKVKSCIPQAEFNALVNPAVIQHQKPEKLKETMIKVIEQGADNLAVVNLSSTVDVEKLRGLFKSFTEIGRELVFEPVITINPFAEEEYGWELPVYQGTRIFHCSDNLEVLIPRV